MTGKALQISTRISPAQDTVEGKFVVSLDDLLTKLFSGFCIGTENEEGNFRLRR
jgi:hypothetical protein